MTAPRGARLPRNTAMLPVALTGFALKLRLFRVATSAYVPAAVGATVEPLYVTVTPVRFAGVVVTPMTFAVRPPLYG